jgi:hypothetical protein
MRHKLIIANLGKSNGAHAQIMNIVASWTQEKLTQPSVWLNVSDPSELRVLSSSGISMISSRDWLADEITRDVELSAIVLQHLRDSKEALSFSEVQEALSFHSEFQKASDTLVNVLVPLEGVTGVKHDAVFDFRLNIVASPSESSAPGAATSFVSKGSEEFAHTAAAIVSLAGLWWGQNKSPLDSILSSANFSPGQNVMAGRAFVRYVDASGLLEKLDTSVKSSDVTSLPAASNEKGVTLDLADNPEIVVTDIARAFTLEKAAQLTYRAPAPLGKMDLKKTGFVDAIKLYFSFLAKWAWAAPGEWAREKVDSVKAAAAKSVQGFLGSESEYEVIVKGVSVRNVGGDYEPDLTQDILKAARAGLGGTQMGEAASPKDLWEHLASVTCNLADGGVGSQTITLPTVGTERTVILDPQFLTPDPASNIFDVPASAPIAMSGVRLRSDDPYSADVVLDQISEALKDSTKLSAVAYAELNKLNLALNSWISSNRSFVWQVGRQLAMQLNAARIDSRSMLQAANSRVDEFKLDEVERNARKSIMNVIKGGVLILALGGLAWLLQAIALFIFSGAWPGSLAANWWVPAAIFVGVLLIWNLIGLVIFSGKVADYNNLQAAIQRDKRRAEWAKANFAVALKEIHRLASLYSQYRLWVKVMSPLFYRNDSIELNDEKPKGIFSSVGNLPQSVVVAELEPEASQSSLLSSVQKSYFKKGWLKDQLDGFVATQTPAGESIWTDTAQSANSALAKLAVSARDPETAASLASQGSSTAVNIATDAETFQNWAVTSRGVTSNKQLTGKSFIDALRFGERSIPMGGLLTAKANVENQAAVSPEKSYFACDARLSPDTDLSNFESLAVNSNPHRSLDFVALRVELSNLISAKELQFVEVEQRASSSGETSSGIEG